MNNVSSWTLMHCNDEPCSFSQKFSSPPVWHLTVNITRFIMIFYQNWRCPQDDSNGRLTNLLVCNYAVAGNMWGASIYAQVTNRIQLPPPVSTRCAKVPSLVEFSWVVQLGISWSLCQVPDITHAIMWQLGSPFPENSKAWQKATNTLVLLWCLYCLLGNYHLT